VSAVDAGTRSLGVFRRGPAPSTVAVLAAYALMFAPTGAGLLADWASSGEYGHGFLLLPVALYLAWKRREARARGNPVVGLLVLIASVGLFLLGVLAAEFFTRRSAMLLAAAGLTLYFRGWTQLRAWWLPFGLLAFTIPLPEVVLNSVTLPLQLLASRMAVGLLELRHVPVGQAGNIIFLPGQELFVAEACSGLRSVSALLGLTLLIAGTSLRTIPGRAFLVGLAIPAAIGANVLRVFATGFGSYYIGPQVATGTAHELLGAVVFVLPLGLVGLVALGLKRIEAR